MQLNSGCYLSQNRKIIVEFVFIQLQLQALFPTPYTCILRVKKRRKRKLLQYSYCNNIVYAAMSYFPYHELFWPQLSNFLRVHSLTQSKSRFEWVEVSISASGIFLPCRVLLRTTTPII